MGKLTIDEMREQIQNSLYTDLFKRVDNMTRDSIAKVKKCLMKEGAQLPRERFASLLDKFYIRELRIRSGTSI